MTKKEKLVEEPVEQLSTYAIDGIVVKARNQKEAIKAYKAKTNSKNKN